LGPPQEWEFQPKDDGSVSWSLHTGDSDGPAAHLQTCSGQYVTTPDAHFIHGGFYYSYGDNGKTISQALDQMFISNFTSDKYQNTTLSNTLNTFRTDGEGQYVPVFGTDGVILYFGGQTPTDPSMRTLVPAALDVITVYDIGSKKFYQQAATNAPASRMNFCSASAGTPGKNGTYEMLVIPDLLLHTVSNICTVSYSEEDIPRSIMGSVKMKFCKRYSSLPCQPSHG
jgi:hypothetical protein